jgi:cell shape-determining protein MreC
MDNEEKAQHQKKLESLKEEVVRLTSLLKQTLESKSGEAKFTTQLEPSLAKSTESVSK